MLNNIHKYKWYNIILWADNQWFYYQIEWTDIECNCYEDPVDCRLDAEAEVNKLPKQIDYFEQRKQIKHQKFLELQSKFFFEMDNFFEEDLFQEYLMDIHGKDYCWLDDDIPDAFDQWYCDLDNVERMNYFTDFITK